MSAAVSRRETWVRSYAAPFAIRVAVWQTACAIALLVAAGVVSMVSADAIAHTVAAGSAVVAAVVLLAAVIEAMLHLAALRMLYHVDCKDTRVRPDNGRAGVLGSHLAWGDPRRGWDFVSTGRGDVPWEDAFRTLRSVGYAGPISIEWEDAGMDRLHGAPEAIAFVRSANSRRRRKHRRRGGTRHAGGGSS
ncbi:AP endonuclease family 2 C terminus [Microbacterium hydrothermale]|nr:AP endonuclease family 2 C terminus [Microbacterium hydrothermale]